MPFETFSAPSRRIAVIGGGISGMAAAHLLASDNAVVLFEAGNRLGGHAHTAQVLLRAMNGQSSTWFCGAYMKNGFYEDGFASTADVAEALGVRQMHREAA